MDLSACGIDCGGCSHFVQNKCRGCRVVAPEGKCVWNGRCELFDCSARQGLEHCGRCASFPCGMLKEWAASENTERIQNLIELSDREKSK